MDSCDFYSQLASEMAECGLFTEEEVSALRRVVRATDLSNSHIPFNLRESLESQSALQSLISYFANRLAFQAAQVKRNLDSYWMSRYDFFRKSPAELPGKFTEKLVDTTIRSEPEFVKMDQWQGQLAYYAEQLKSLQYAIVARGRMLEQLSNNARAEARVEVD